MWKGSCVASITQESNERVFHSPGKYSRIFCDIYHNIYIVIAKKKKKKNCDRQSCKTGKQANKQKNKLEALWMNTAFFT